MQCGRILRRATIFTSDAETSAGFYTQALGMTVYSDQRIELPAHSPVTLGATDGPRPARFITVKGTHPFAGMIGLISMEGDVDDRLAGGRLGIGNVVLVIEVEDIVQVPAAIERAGGRVVRPLHDAQNTAGLNGEKIPSRRLFARDPDGYVLELFEPD